MLSKIFSFSPLLTIAALYHFSQKERPILFGTLILLDCDFRTLLDIPPQVDDKSIQYNSYLSS